MKQRSFLLTLMFFALLLVGCADDKLNIDAPTISGVEETYTTTENGTITLSPKVDSDNNVVYSWLLNGEEVTTTLEYTFEGKEVGEYELTFRATNNGGASEVKIKITVYASSSSIDVEAYSIVELELPEFVGEDAEFTIEVVDSEFNLYRLTKNEAGAPLFVAAEAGDYVINLLSNGLSFDYIVTVSERNKEVSAYTAKVFDYLPSPGQFVNQLPAYVEGDTHEDMVAKTEKALVGSSASMITLGGWGGYVTLGFDHTIVNVPGKSDFRIHGNAFGSAANPRPDAPFGGSCEPAIIMVAYDKNKNGKPDDDEWYEIAGSGNFTAENEAWYDMAKKAGNDVNTYRDYEMTFHRPDVEDNNVTDTYIRWTDNKGNEGYKVKNQFHRQSYYPLWINEDKITYKGIRLADNGIDESGQGSYYVLYAYKYGYADNYPNNDTRAAIDIDWAIDKDGKPANLPGVDFVKVINGVDKENGWLGETSTEVSKGEDLHALGIDIDTIIE